MQNEVQPKNFSLKNRLIDHGNKKQGLPGLGSSGSKKLLKPANQMKKIKVPELLSNFKHSALPPKYLNIKDLNTPSAGGAPTLFTSVQTAATYPRSTSVQNMKAWTQESNDTKVGYMSRRLSASASKPVLSL